MVLQKRVEPVDYLAIGHITVDETAEGPRMGGAVTYAALTAQALGLRAGIVTAWGEELPLDALSGIQIINVGIEGSTRFENIYSEGARRQRIIQQAEFLEFHHIPETWRSAPLLHLAPVAREVSPRILKYFGDSMICATPQGWLRDWDADGRVTAADWPEAEHILARLDACVLGLEDVGGEISRVEAMAALCPALILTAGKVGATLYSRGEETHFAPPEVAEVDPTGAGDIFAAAFFVQLYRSGDAAAAAHLATQLAAKSVTRAGLAGVPTRDEVFDLLAEAV